MSTAPMPGVASEEAIQGGPQLPTIPSGATPQLRQQLAERGRRDLYFLCRGILGYTKLTPRAHAAFCRFVQGPIRYKGRDIIRRLMLMPRDHLKTTIASIGDTIRLIVNDPSERILIVASTADIAQSIMGEIKNHFENNELFRWLYSDIIPNDLSRVTWNKEEITVKRDVFFKEPTVFTIGARGAVQSRHFTRIKGDDIIGEKEYQSEAEMKKTIRWAKGLEALLVTEFIDTIDITGTRWKQGDVYAELEEFYSGGAGEGGEQTLGPHAKLRGELAIFHRHARDEESGEPFFPEMVSREYLDRLMVADPEQYAAWYANDPTSSGLNTFEQPWLRFYKLAGIESKTVVWQEGGEEKQANYSELERMILYDPAVSEHKKACRNAMLVVGALRRSKAPLVFLLEARIGHYKPDESVDILFELNHKWRPDFISIEKHGYQAALKYWLQERAEHDKLPYLPVREFPPKGTPNSQLDKDERIKGLQPLFRSGQIWLQEGMTEFLEEYIYYPDSKFRDALDALAQGLVYWPTSQNEDLDKEMDAYSAKVLASIDADGYSIRRGSPLHRAANPSADDWDEESADYDTIHWRGVEIRV